MCTLGALKETMKLSYLLTTLVTVLVFNFLNAQKRAFDPTNARDGENIEYCLQHKKMAELLSDPQIAQMWENDKIAFEKALDNPVPKGVVYTIPVVFHILHNNGIENISDEQIYDAVEIMNRDFRRLNADANNVQSDFQGMPSDVEVEFVLATKAPNGTCFKGITRTMSAYSYLGDNGNAQVNAIINGNDVYQNTWPGNKYLNIFVCGEIGGAAGYTTNPGSWSASSMTNGIWVLHDYVGSIGTSGVYSSRTLTHEVGHWLNLDHTWGGNNNPGNASSCSTDDSVNDTPNCIGVTSCNLNANTCNSINSYWNFDVKDNVENYMDYSYCSKMFTQGQVDRMRAALQVTSTGRKNLWQASNLTATGATGDLYLCKANFTSDRTAICQNDSIQLLDDSYNLVTSWSWEITPSTGWTFAPGSNANTQNPMVYFTDPGLYSVKLTASDGSTTDVELKSNYLRVLPDALELPYFEGFEGYTSLSNTTNWEIYNPNNNNQWTLESSTGHSGTKCAKLQNFGQGIGNVDELTSTTIDLSPIVNEGTMTLSFRYAYRKKTSSDYEFLKVFISGDCGAEWAQRKTLGGNNLGSQTSSSSWTPSQSSDWTTVHMINVTSGYWTPNFKVKFRFEGEGGNNIFLDDINIYGGSPSDDPVLGMNELLALSDLRLFPNPAENEINVSFGLSQNELLEVEICDLSGKKISKDLIQAKEGTNLIHYPTNHLSNGMYTIKVGSGKALRFVVSH